MSQSTEAEALGLCPAISDLKEPLDNSDVVWEQRPGLCFSPLRSRVIMYMPHSSYLTFHLYHLFIFSISSNQSSTIFLEQ